MKYDSKLVFYVNGERHEIDDPDPRTLLLDYLRSPDVGLTGAKKGCGQGGCGCCTTMLSNWDPSTQSVVHRSINSCMHPLASMHGMALTTVEGTGNTNVLDTKGCEKDCESDSGKIEVTDKPCAIEGVSPIQWTIAKNNGSQCGYCTPGWVMTMHSAMAAQPNKRWTPEEIEQQFDGNLCRCTGYRAILQGMKELSPDYDPKGSMSCIVDPAERPKQSHKIVATFPDVLKEPSRPASYARGRFRWTRPVTLKQLYEARAAAAMDPECDVKLVVGNTSIGIYPLYQDNPHALIDISQVPELRAREVTDEALLVGGAVTYSEMIAFLDETRTSFPKHRQAAFDALHYMADRTAGHIIRNAASLAGNTMLVVSHVAEGVPFPSDLFTALASLDTVLTVGSPNWDEPREYPILDYAHDWAHTEELKRDAIILGYRIPIPGTEQIARTYKVAIRHENAHSIANAGMRVGFDSEGKVNVAAVVFGGIGPVAFHAAGVEQYLLGRSWDAETLGGAMAQLQLDVSAVIKATLERMASVPDEGFSNEYRQHLAESYLYQFFVHVLESRDPSAVPAGIRRAGERVMRPVTGGTQKYEKYPGEYPVNEPYVKLTAFQQACGEVMYTHDLPLPREGIEGAMVTSPYATALAHYAIPGGDGHASAKDVADHLRERFPSFVDYVSCGDMKPDAVLQGEGNDEPLLTPIDTEVPGYPKGELRWFGQQIGLVLAKDLVRAQWIANYVQTEVLQYDVPGKDVVTFEEAVEKDLVFPDSKSGFPVHIWKVIRPESEFEWTKKASTEVNDVLCDVLHNEHQCGGQFHFYMETQSAFATRGADHKLSIIASTQSPNSVTTGAQATVGLAQNLVNVKVPHVGGGYGGKTTRSPFTSNIAALAAWKTGRPVKVAFTREVDTAMVGHRHPLISKHSVAIGTGKDDPENRGKLMGLDASYYFDGGATYDCSFTVMDCLQLRSDSAYMVRNYQTEGEVCQTNKTSNTAYRAFGLIQAMLAYEDSIERAAHHIGMLAEDVREKNLYAQGDVTAYGQELSYCYMPEVWGYARKTTKFDERLEAVREFNSKNKWIKRGISLMPLKYCSGYNLTSLEQGGALIEAFTDGSVLIRHGGVEMGQGIKTKVTQIAALELNLPVAALQTGVTDTHVVPNPVSTGASTGSVLNGGAVKKAAKKLAKRLKKYCKALRKTNGEPWCAKNHINYWDFEDGWRHSNGSGGMLWNNIIKMANGDRVNLSTQVRYRQSGGTQSDLEGKATGLVFKPGVKPEAADHFEGFTFSAGCSEVEVNILTGETLILRSDVIYDIGKSLNPAIDVGQVEGAFIQGVGFVLTEELVYQESGATKGNLNTVNTWGYKLPATSTIPVELNVDLYPLRDLPKDFRTNADDLLGAKEVGEPPLVLATTVYLAIKRALLASREERGTKGWFALEAPATVQRVREAAQVEASELTL